MNYKKLSDDELLKLINSSTDTKVLANAESEFIDRFTNESDITEENRWIINESDIDEDIIVEINKTWRAN